MNNLWPEYLTALSEERISQLSRSSCYLRVIEETGTIAAFFMAFRKGASYDGTIFRLFHAQEADFVYLDRMAVDRPFQGRGLPALFYDDMFRFVRKLGAGLMFAEIDVDPPNETSLKIHRRLGFEEIGRHKMEWLGKMKIVALMKRMLADVDSSVP